MLKRTSLDNSFYKLCLHNCSQNQLFLAKLLVKKSLLRENVKSMQNKMKMFDEIRLFKHKSFSFSVCETVCEGF